jgi:hypothetical protein
MARTVWKNRLRWKDGIALYHEEMCVSVAWIHLVRDDVSFCRAVVNTVINARVP